MQEVKAGLYNVDSNNSPELDGNTALTGSGSSPDRKLVTYSKKLINAKQVTSKKELFKKFTKQK